MSKGIHTENEWRVMLEEMRASGETAKTWFGSRGIPLSQYYYWRRRLNNEKDEFENTPPRAPVFVELKMESEEDHSSPQDSPFTPEAIIQVDTYRIYVGKTISLQTLTTVLTALNHA